MKKDLSDCLPRIWVPIFTCPGDQMLLRPWFKRAWLPVSLCKTWPSSTRYWCHGNAGSKAYTAMESSTQISNESLRNRVIGNRVRIPLTPMCETARITINNITQEFEGHGHRLRKAAGSRESLLKENWAGCWLWNTYYATIGPEC